MKNLFLLLTLFFTANCFAQAITYDQVTSKKKRGNIKEYITKTGETFAVGDTLTLGNPVSGDKYSGIRQKLPMSEAPLSQNANNTTVVIKRMNAQYGRLACFTTKPAGFGFGLYIISLDRVIENGEIVTDNLTSENAIAKLKKLKEKLDLELITKEEYNAAKAELSKFID